MCGSSALSDLGQEKCTCLGKNRAFQVSDGSCVCKSGFVFYNLAEIKEEEGNSDKDCQLMVTDRCAVGQARLASTRQCITVGAETEEYCRKVCGNAGGKFITDTGRCTCNQNVLSNSYCDRNCENTAPKVQVQRNEETGALMIITSVRDS
jgi:hypothetical protein